MKDRTKKYALGTILAAVAGYVTGILTAPKSGKETRKDIKKGAVNAKNEAEAKLKQGQAELQKMIGKAKTETQHLKGTVKQQADKSLAAIVETKDKVQNVIKDGSKNDRELKRALKEVNDALGHLKTYIGQYGKAAKDNFKK
jgi:gas vesicle protein